MTKRQQAHRNMCVAVLQFLLNNAGTTATVAAFAPIFTAFTNKLTEWQDAIAGEAAIITGTATNKRALKLSLCKELKRIGDAIASYAATISDNELREAVNIPLSELKKMKDETLIAQGNNYHDLADVHIAALAPWNILPADVTALATLIGGYSTAAPSPRNKKAERTAYNKAQALCNKEALAILKEQMDPLMFLFAETNADFYNEYKQNRVIVDAATSATKIKGTILSGIDDKPLQGVAVTVVGTGLSAITDQKGKFTVKGLTPGTYSVHFVKPGFIDKTIDEIEVKLGKPSNVNTTLSQAA